MYCTWVLWNEFWNSFLECLFPLNLAFLCNYQLTFPICKLYPNPTILRFTFIATNLLRSVILTKQVFVKFKIRYPKSIRHSSNISTFFKKVPSSQYMGSHAGSYQWKWKCVPIQWPQGQQPMIKALTNVLLVKNNDFRLTRLWYTRDKECPEDGVQKMPRTGWPCPRSRSTSSAKRAGRKLSANWTNEWRLQRTSYCLAHRAG